MLAALGTCGFISSSAAVAFSWAWMALTMLYWSSQLMVLPGGAEVAHGAEPVVAVVATKELVDAARVAVFEAVGREDLGELVVRDGITHGCPVVEVDVQAARGPLGEVGDFTEASHRPTPTLPQQG